MISIGSSGKGRGKGAGKDSGSHTEDDALWDIVTREIKPLSGKGDIVPAKPARISQANALPPQQKAITPAQAKPAVRSPGDREVDRRTDQRLKRGQYPVDFTLDLHGLRQEAAHNKLRSVLRRAQAQDQRCVLVITGKGRSEGGVAGQGVLRRKVPEWLSEESMHTIVLRYHEAQPEHGGAGALYVLLRRTRTAD